MSLDDLVKMFTLDHNCQSVKVDARGWGSTEAAAKTLCPALDQQIAPDQCNRESLIRCIREACRRVLLLAVEVEPAYRQTVKVVAWVLNSLEAAFLELEEQGEQGGTVVVVLQGWTKAALEASIDGGEAVRFDVLSVDDAMGEHPLVATR